MLAVFRPFVLRVLRVLGVPKYSQHVKYTREYDVYFDQLCTVSIISSAFLLLHKTFNIDGLSRERRAGAGANY